MIALPGYQILTKIYESDRSLVCRGYREEDHYPVILKLLKEDYPTPLEIVKYRQEYEIIHHFKLQGVITAYDLKKYQNTLVIILEDFGGQSLNFLLKTNTFNLQELLEIAIKITDSLANIHDAKIIHKDLNPSNIVFNRETQQLKIIDFGISTLLPREELTLQNPNVIEGTLAYLSPEQTGRMNRSLDYRTDFYSLGVTLYELLTQQLPFDTQDVMELVHCHLAKQPLAPHKLNSEIPQILSEIVMKLLSKRPEKRYQSARGIKADLERCLSQLQTTQKIVGFPLGSQDISERFQISAKLYGREAEINRLLNSFERVSQGTKELMLISGYSGIGKSVLVREIYQPLTQTRGYFITGKFDQYQRDIPYSGIVKAFQELVRQLLTENESQFNQWRQKIHAALGVNAQVIIDLIPEVELILGKQPSVPNLPALEAQNRLNLVFQNFVQVFTQSEHPLVIFLDDLQWADPASLKLMQLLITESKSKVLFLIGAYRDREVSAVHPLTVTLEKIQKLGGIVNQLSLKPLDLKSANQLISDSLKCSPQKTEPLTHLILEKTDGNPFFINEFLKSLDDEKLLYFDNIKGAWQWDLDHIKAQEITANVVDLMTLKIQKLTPKAQQILKLGACIGNKFDWATLASLSQQSPQETASYLNEAVGEGLITPLKNSYQVIDLDLPQIQEDLTLEYKFLHDRIQQAAYSLLSLEQKQSLHAAIGQLLRQNIAPSKQEQKIFDILNHLNLGVALIKRQSQRDELAQLNLRGSQKAKASAAYESAANYLKVGRELLEETGWQRNYPLMLKVYTESAEVAYLNTDFEQMEQFVQTVLQKATTLLDKVKVYEVKIKAYKAQNKPLEAIKTALSVLSLLGVRLPEKPRKWQVLLGFMKTKVILAGKKIDDLVNLPEMTDPYHKAAIRILASIVSVTYLASPQLLPLIVFKQVNLSVRYGNTAVSALSYANYGGILCGILKDIETGYRFGQLALNLVDKLNAKALKGRTLYIVNACIRHWKEPVEELVSSFCSAYQSALETGDLEFAAWSTYNSCLYPYWIGQEMSLLEKEMTKGSEIIAQLKQDLVFYENENYRQHTSNLLGNKFESNFKNSLINIDFYCSENIRKLYDNESTMLSFYAKENNRHAICHWYINKIVFCYLFEEYDQAVETANLVEDYLDGAIASLILPQYYFYDSLVRLAVFNQSTNQDQNKILDRVKANQKKMKRWAYYAPKNYGFKFYLVEAERHRILGQEHQARDLYDQAIELAKEQERLNEEALGYELAAKFYLATYKIKIAQLYLMESRYAYLRWGATPKVKQLEKNYPDLLALKSGSVAAGRLQDTQTTLRNTRSSEVLDLATVLKASQVLASEIVLDNLLKKLVNIAIENAGAQTGFLILEQEEQLFITAKKTVNDEIVRYQSKRLETCNHLPLSLINYVARTRKEVVLSDGTSEEQFITDPYIIQNQPKSILCTPIIHQDKLIGVLYLENNLTTEAFTSERLEVLQILSSQAAISLQNAQLYEEQEHHAQTLEQTVTERTQELSQTLEILKATQAKLIFENDLLRSAETPSHYDYQVGGSLATNSPTYVVRAADRYLYQALKRGDFCYVLNARQMGKSSLMVRMLKQLKQENFCCAALDLTRIGSETITPEKWYKGIAVELLQSFDLFGKISLKKWWQERSELSLIQRLSYFIEDILLVKAGVSEDTPAKKLVIFIDEIDSVLGLNFPVNDFFALIRYCYNQRSLKPEYERLTFALFGVATPSDLMTDIRTTPFNIGQSIQLEGFKEHEAQPLLQGLIPNPCYDSRVL
jgi:predicted ATPase/GAF domain-containing protein/tRNA A-37 threonylcarbamoyl transferase component Bud32